MPGPTLLATDPREEALLALYRRAERRISQEISAAITRGARGTFRFYANQSITVKREIERLRVQAPPLERALAASAYTTGVSAVEATVDRSAAFSDVHAAAVDVLAGNLAGRLRFAEEFVGRMANDTFRRVGLEQTGLAMATGLDARSQRLNIEQELRRNGITAFVDRRGRRWTLTNYAKMVTRTTTREAASAGTENRMREIGLDLVKISKHTGACPICVPLQGRTFSLTGISKNYPHLRGKPPFHPNCRHVMYPAPADFEEFERSLGLGPDPHVAEQMKLGEQPQPDKPKPIVSTPLGSGGRPLGGRVVLPSSRSHARPPADRALDEIASIHGVPPEMKSTVGIRTNNSMRAYGSFAPLVLTQKALPGAESMIEVNTKRQGEFGQAATIAHEIGHFLDYNLFGSGLTGASARWKKDHDDEKGRVVADLMQTLDASPEIQAIREALRTGGREDFGISRYTTRGYLRYLLDPEEIFARAYSQYVASKSGDPRWLEAIEEDRKGVRPRQWAPETFGAIQKAFDRLFSDLDLLRS